MKTPLLSLAAVALAAALGSAHGNAQAAGQAEVSYPGSDQYVDIGFGGVERERTLEAMTGHFERLAKRLPDGHVLRVTMKDIDLAGHVKWIDMRPMRVLGTLPDWPRLSFHYELLAGGQALSAGDETLTDLAYLGRLTGVRQNQPLAHEAALLDTWFKERLAPRVAAAQ